MRETSDNRPSFTAATMSLKEGSFGKGKGPSIKYVTLEGEGVREGVTVCDRGGQEYVTSRLYIFLSYI